MQLFPDRTPLEWPPGWKRTPGAQRQRARPTARANVMRHAVIDDLGRMGASTAWFSFSQQPAEWAVERGRGDPGVAVYWELRGRTYVLAVDRYSTATGNLHAIYQLIGALAAGGQANHEAFHRLLSGLRTVTPDSDVVVEDIPWWRMLGFEQIPPKQAAEKAHRKLVLQIHPDRGGSNELLRLLNDAWSRARAHYGRTRAP